jgi:RNA recognition motif-containing protein
VRSLPLNATPQQLEEEFKRFGTIKHEGIQVRSNKVHAFLHIFLKKLRAFSESNSLICLCVSVESTQIQGFCYGFVEFEDASAVQAAIEVLILHFTQVVL